MELDNWTGCYIVASLCIDCLQLLADAVSGIFGLGFMGFGDALIWGLFPGSFARRAHRSVHDLRCVLLRKSLHSWIRCRAQCGLRQRKSPVPWMAMLCIEISFSFIELPKYLPPIQRLKDAPLIDSVPQSSKGKHRGPHRSNPQPPYSFPSS